MRAGMSNKNRRLDHVAYWKSHGPTPYFREYHEMISGGEIPPRYSRLVPFISGSSILDVGCGEGLLPLVLAKPAKVVGIDISPKRVEIANDLLNGPYSAKKGFVSFISGDAIQYICTSPLPETVVMNRVLYHFAQDVLLVRDALRKSTAVKAVVLVGNNAKKNLTASEHDLGKWVHYSTVEGMSKFLNEAGFTNVKIVEISDSDPIVIGSR